ncbi:hypothetical protein DL764_000612 [Monosporascus ibericus]|uniref:Major facilitator superfamily (MFS) profile domain-containing protein n=1 Tax=Monosporascus ibericus TaxID=155417 RepID=A0A4V1XCP1_9PEZI|nr:hypothetical protein DL764_000612 [Monosporascus ibericus]
MGSPKEHADDSRQQPTADYPKGWTLGLLTIGICLTIFVISLDFSIIATAIPKITSEFRSLEDVGWYGSAYLLTTASTQLLVGKLYTIFSLKWVFLLSLLIFELGSVICAAAPSSIALIFGRAVAGCGNAGLLSGALLIIAHSVPLRRRPLFTPKLDAAQISQSVFDLIKRFDPLGTLVFMPAIVCILLALQWGGTTYPWKSGSIIALFVVSGVLLVSFIVIQWRAQDNATVPPRIFKNRTIWSCAIYQFTLGAGFFVFIYFVPLWFQAVQGVSAIESGTRNLPMLIGNIVGTTIAGILVAVTGYYAPFMYIGTIITSVGAGLLTLFNPGTSSAEWIGYQAMVGLGIGFGWQQPLVAVQTALDLKDVPVATAILSFTQTVGGSIFVSVAQAAFSNKLVQELSTRAPGLDPKIVLDGGAGDIANLVPQQYLPEVIMSYNNGLTNSFVVGTAMVAASIMGCVFVEWNSVKGIKRDATVVA